MFARFIGFCVGHNIQCHLPIHESEDSEVVGQESVDGLTDGEETNSDTGYGGDTGDGVDTGEGSQSEKGESEDESTSDESEDSDSDISIEDSETGDGDLDDEDRPQFKF